MSKRPRLGQIALVAVLFALTIRGAAQTIPTNGVPQGARTGMIFGQVVDATTGAPMPDAIVRINLPKYAAELPTTPRGRVMADDEGRFFFPDLPPGDYWLQASADGYADGVYGQQRPLGQYQLLAISEGEHRMDVKLRVWKYAVISGTVVDEAGEPVIGIGVRALTRTIVGGRVQYGTTQVRADLVPIATTDDRGAFRLSQLLPGSYAIVVPSTQTTIPVGFVDGKDFSALTELSFSGVQELAPVGQPKTVQVGNVAMVTPSRMPIPPVSSATGSMQVYKTTFYPVASTASEATAIAVKAGEERGDVAIALRPAPAVRISGRMITPDGSAPPPMALYLSGEASVDNITRRPASSDGFDTAVAMSDGTGQFTFLGVPTGQYTLKQANPFLSRAIQTGVPTYWVSQPLAVGGADITDLTVRLNPALRVEGRFEFPGATGPQPMQGVAGVRFETPFGEQGQFSASMNRDGSRTFVTLGAGGRYFIRPYELDGWFVQSVSVGGSDYTDRPFELTSDTKSIVVTYTDRPSKITGTVKDARGAASSAATVLAFPVDRSRWTGYGESPRDLVSATTSTTGVYTIPNLPPGDYYVIAIDADDAEAWQDPKTLQTLSARATKIAVGAGDPARTLDLTVTGIR